MYNILKYDEYKFAYKANEGIDWGGIIGGLVLVGLFGGLLWLSFKLDKQQREDIERILNKYFTKEELRELYKIVKSDRKIRSYIEEIESHKKLDRNVKRTDFKNSTANEVKNTMSTFYKEHSVKSLTRRIEDRIEEILPKDLYDSYLLADDEIYGKYGIHFLY